MIKINKKMLILLAALIVLVVALVIFSSLNKTGFNDSNINSNINSNGKKQTTPTGQNQLGTVQEVTENLNGTANGALIAVGTSTELVPATPGSAALGAAGTPQTNQNFSPTNPSVTSNNPTVLSSLSSMPGTSEAPKQEVIAADKIPGEALKLTVSDAGFSPKEFTIQAGQKVSLAITSLDMNTHVFIFPNAALMGLQTMVLGQETKLLTFTAPDPGIYEFRDDIPNLRANTGKMIIK